MTDPNFYRRRGTAIRAHTMADPVPSQDVSRFKAVDISPDYWGEKPPPIRWRLMVPLTALAVVIALVIVAPFAMDWSAAWKLAVAVPVAVLGIVALRWLR